MLKFLVDNIFVVSGGGSFPTGSRHSNGNTLCPSPCQHISVLTRSRIHTVFNFDWKETARTSRWAWDKRHEEEQHLYFLLGFTPVYLNGRSNAHFPLRKNVTISTSISETFRFWIAIFHLRHPMTFYYLTTHTVCRVCSSYERFIQKATRLSSKLLGQGYVGERLKSSPRKLYGRYGDLIKHFEVSLFQCYMTFWDMTIYSDIP